MDVAEPQPSGNWRSHPHDRIVLDTLAEGVVVMDAAGEIVQANAAATRILGLNVADLTGRTSFDPRWRAVAEDGSPLPGERHPAIVTLRTGRIISDFVMGVEEPNGALHWISVNTRPLANDAASHDGIGRVVATFVDVTARRQSDAALRESRARSNAILQHAPIGMAVVALDGRIVETNAALLAILGVAQDDAASLTFGALGDASEPNSPILQRLRDGIEAAVTFEQRCARPDGTRLWVSVTIAAVRDDGGTPLYFVAQVQNVDDRKAEVSRLHDLSRRDALSGLLNRRALDVELPRLLARAKADGTVVHVIMGDLDRFKALNDTFGHAAGDAVLRRVGALLRENVRPGDFVFRYGGEEFAIVVRDVSAGTVAACVERIRRRVESSMTVDGVRIETSMSFGIASSAACGGDANELVRAADAALYRAKRSGRNTICFAGATGGVAASGATTTARFAAEGR